MPHHFTKNTVEAKFWCDPCGRETIHRVDDGRRGPCLVCLEKREKQVSLPGIDPPQQEEMFSLPPERHRDEG